MYYHLILTDECNLRCSYCRGRFDVEPASCKYNEQPEDFTLDTDSLRRFLEQDPGAVLIFYGGEPLLRTDLVEEFVREMPVNRFILHTNGTLLERPGHDTLAAIEKIQVSIDGDREINDRNRGTGTYEQVTGNVKKIRRDGYKGEVVARMTVEKGTCIRDAVIHLDSLRNFSSVHWQLNAMFYDDYDPTFREWAREEYNPSIKILAEEWIRIMENEGRVPRWYPFLAPVSGMLAGGNESGLRCGSGHMNYTITTDGGIVPCPCMYGFVGYDMGHINDSHPQNLPKARIGDPCSQCEINGFCGGRCLYAHAASLWPEEGRTAVCGTVRNLKETLEATVPGIKELISDGIIKEEDFYFEPYWGCEVIP